MWPIVVVDYIPWTVNRDAIKLSRMGKKTHVELLGILAANVKTFREGCDYSQEELADLAELDRTYISQLERAKCNPSLLVLSKVAESLGVRVIDLLE